MFTGPEIVAILTELGFTHVIWVPDTTLGPWEEALESSKKLQLVRVCREGEAWPLAAGLLLGGKMPLVVMQTTGLYESGDALRNVLYDLKLPVFALIGVRNALVPESTDSAKAFALLIVKAWQLNDVWITCEADKPKFAEHVRQCRADNTAGVIMLAEGAP
ncbi:thiamine pyrophosphate-binding protein [Anatilimnocola floriformis]|uniref:thiamine pyrophosphate-binding protein n=1 Tax=Anatilimnocola floriformis TaxID=2948575 RepID=UPI0020C4E851|nr:thiamine pyrophosphate-binding protein [Anatilimnocola floriformis]